MKKLLKFLLGVAAIVGSIAGVLYILDKRKEDDDMDEFDDDEFDDIFAEKTDDRDYVTLDIDEEDNQDAEATAQE